MLAASALLFQLTKLAPTLSPTEAAMLATSASWRSILAHPTDLPLKSLQWLTGQIPISEHVLLARLPSVLLAVVALVIFTYILRRWYG